MTQSKIIKRLIRILVVLLIIILGTLILIEHKISEEIDIDCVGEVHRAGEGLIYENYQFSFRFVKFRWFARLFGQAGVGYAQAQNYDSILIPKLEFINGFRVILLKGDDDWSLGQYYGLIKRIEYRWAKDHTYIGVCNPNVSLH